MILKHLFMTLIFLFLMACSSHYQTPIGERSPANQVATDIDNEAIIENFEDGHSKKEYIMYQKWSHLLMAHWSLPPNALRKLVPPELEIDTFDGKAYVGAVALEMTDGKILGYQASNLSLYNPFPQLNLRTYVKYKGKRGIYFFKIYAKHRLAAVMADIWFGMPYVYEKLDFSLNLMKMSFNANLNNKPMYQIEGSNIGETRTYHERTIQRFLTARPMSFQLLKNKSTTCVYSAELWHEEWELTDVDIDIKYNNLLTQNGLPVTLMKRLPFNFYVPSIDSYAYPSEKLGCHKTKSP